jgi:hypothetical protein
LGFLEALSQGRKRTFEEVSVADYSKYGVTKGVMVQGTEVKPLCGIICKGWPSWAFGATLRGWNVNIIIMKESVWSKRIKIWFANALVVDPSQCANYLHCLTKIDAWFSDIDPPRCLPLWDSNASLIITARRARHVPNSKWCMEPVTTSHVSSGGVTDGTWTVYIYNNGPSPRKYSLNASAPRDLGGALDTMKEGRPCPAPPDITSTLPQVHQIRPNTYHGHGILPWKARDSFVIAPCIFSPTNWVRRRFSNVEMLKVLDVPDCLSRDLSTSETRAVIDDTSLIPLKVICQILDSLPELAPNSSTKRPRLVNRSTDKSIQEISKEDTFVDGSHDMGTTLEVPDRISRNTKAAKNDDAEVPEYLWNEAIVSDGNVQKLFALTHLRTFALRWWKRHTTRDFLNWLSSRHPNIHSNDDEYQKDKSAGQDCIRRCAESTWWEWNAGSRPLFWRWPEDYRHIIRDGVPPWVKGPLPHYTVPQRPEKDQATRDAIILKLKLVRDKGYLVPGEVKSLTSFFTVPKGDGDVRMVYDGTKSGLNAQLWAPWFPLPTIDSHLRCIQSKHYMGDIDFSEQFLNFVLHERVRSHAGVDLTLFFPEECSETKRLIWEHWVRCGMGFVSSPYNAVQGTLMAEEKFRGDHLDPKNIFRWDKIVLNLPGCDSYNPCDPWVFKIRFNSEGQEPTIANDLVIYVDDVRTMACSYEECRLASRAVASMANHLGLQDAARKRRDPSQTPGPWAGCIVASDKDVVVISVSLERWLKAKGMVAWIKLSIQSSDLIDHKTLESYRGFLIYVSRTYPAIVPYLKGIHLTLDSWRPWRAEDAWKMTMSEIKVALDERGLEDIQTPTGGKPTSQVKIAPRLRNDVEALFELFLPDFPPQRPVRPKRSTEALYMFGDASGTGFGSSLFIDNKLYYQHGQWSSDSSRESSNFRELSNLINAIKDASRHGFLEDMELFVFTDNWTAESAFFKGTSSSRKLFDLVLDLRKLQMHSGLMIHMIHIAGQRMISQGTDGLSRGTTTEGVMIGTPFLSFVPLHLSALTRQGFILKDWVLSWFSGPDKPLILEPKDWFLRGHKYTTCIWEPPPAAADVALEQLAYAIHKRPQHIHVVLIPRLMTARWRKMLGKICNLVFTVPLGSDVWNHSQFEPLIVGLYLPLSRHKPWNLRNTLMLERVERMLREMPPTHPRWGRVVLRELLQQARSLESLPSSVVRSLLYPIGR